MSNFQKDLYNKSKAELTLLAKEYNIIGYKKLNKGELVSAIEEQYRKLDLNDNSVVKANFLAGFWGKYHNHIYGFTSIIGLVIAITTFFPKDFLSKSKIEFVQENPNVTKSIAVLPFKNWSGDSKLEYFCDGMTDEVINRLTRIDAFDKVTSRTSAFKYKNSEMLLVDIAKELDVSHVLEGSFQKVGSQIKINLQLINAETDDHFWTDEFSGEWNSNDIFDIQSAVAGNVIANMDLNLEQSNLENILHAPTINTEAYKFYLQAEYERFKENNQSYLNAIPLYEKAINLDTTFARAYQSLSYVYLNGGLIWGLFPEKIAASKAIENLNKANSIEPSIILDKNLLAIEFYYNWNLEKTEKLYAYTLEIIEMPEGDGTSDYLMKTGRYNESINWSSEFSDKFPLVKFMYAHKAKALILAGRLNEAEELLYLRDAVSNDDQWYLRESAFAHFYLGQYDDLRNRTIVLKTNFSDRAPAHVWLDAIIEFEDKKSKINNSYLDVLKQMYADKNSGSPAWFISMYNFHIGEIDAGFDWLNTSYQDHEVEMTWLKEELLLKPHREDSRYQDIYNAMGWPLVN